MTLKSEIKLIANANVGLEQDGMRVGTVMILL